MKTYQILSTIRYKGKDLKSGLVTLDAEMAQELLASGHITGPIDVKADGNEAEASTASANDEANAEVKPSTRKRGR